jgi:hypothetical protein
MNFTNRTTELDELISANFIHPTFASILAMLINGCPHGARRLGLTTRWSWSDGEAASITQKLRPLWHHLIGVAALRKSLLYMHVMLRR